MRRLASYAMARPGTWQEQVDSFMLDEARRKRQRFPAFVKGLRKAFHDMPGLASGGIPEPDASKTYQFISGTLPASIAEWITLCFNVSMADIVTGDDCKRVYEGEAIYKCTIVFPVEILDDLESKGVGPRSMSRQTGYREFTRVVCKALFDALTRVLRAECKVDWTVTQLSNVLETTGKETSVVMLLSFNSYVIHQRPMDYFQGNLLDYITHALESDVKNETAKKRLQAMQERLRRLVRKLYNENQGEIIAAIKHFECKASLMRQVSYFYEVLAFIVSRLDLGVTAVQELLGRYGQQRDLSEEEMMINAFLLDMVSEQALLFTTFQSNFNGLETSVGNVLMIVLQYYLIDLDEARLSEKIFRGNLLHEKIESVMEKKKINMANFSAFFQNFLMNHYKVQDHPRYDALMEFMLGHKPIALVQQFFSSFLKTSHEKIMFGLEQLSRGDKTRRKTTFEHLVNFLSDFLIFGIREVFLQPRLADASKKFKDPLNRFSEDNIAMSMLELLVYRELPFQDNQWMATMVMQHRMDLDIFPTTLGKDRDVFKDITPEIVMNVVIHDRAMKKTTRFLHEWFFQNIIQPFFDFCSGFLCKEGAGSLDATRAFVNEQRAGTAMDEAALNELARLTMMLFES